VLGVDPGPFTLRQLVWMYRGRQIAEWDRVAMVTAAVLQTMGDYRGGLRGLNPYRKKQGRGFMRPVELYARMRAIDRAKSKK